jgi:hypothetical protein
MNEAERLARGHRAKAAWEEFVEPIIAGMKSEYTRRIADAAISELHPGNRSDKITTLAVGLRVAENIESGIKAIITDGDLAQRDKVRADNVERMSDAQRRLLNIRGY